MVFSSVIFLFYFLPLTLAVYFIVRKELRNTVLLLASLVFYIWGEPRFIVILLLSICVNYAVGLAIDIFRGKKISVVLLVGGIVANLGILFYYKYFDFLIGIINRIFSIVGWGGIGYRNIALPIGLSFFTFQGLSYVIDVYKGKVPVQRNPLHIALYIAMFPQLVAGPIVRYEDIYGDISHRDLRTEDLVYGAQRFIIGLSKKVMIADILAVPADRIFSCAQSQLTPSIAWLGAVCYMFQIFFDFSGYSDMAIGLGTIFGFHFAENFNLPYLAHSVSEFWRRWHISLSSWFRDYLYIPMGGNRKGNMYLHLLVVFLCTGLWHGANFTFVVWGLWHGAFLIIERQARNREIKIRIPTVIMWGYTMLVVLTGWVLFRADSLSYAGDFLQVMCGYCPAGFKNYNVLYYLDNQVVFTLCVAAFLSLGIPKKIRKVTGEKLQILWKEYLAFPVCWFLLFCSASMIVSNNYSPFIYFRF